MIKCFVQYIINLNAAMPGTSKIISWTYRNTKMAKSWSLKNSNDFQTLILIRDRLNSSKCHTELSSSSISYLKV